MLEKDAGMTKEKRDGLYQAVFAKWLALHEPYWKMSDPREYTYQAMLAAYQLGISVILEKYGY